MADTGFETLTLYFENRKGGPTDTERFEITIHRSGTVRVEIGRRTYYGFWQQIPNIVRIEAVLNELNESNDDSHFGSYAFDREDDAEIIFARARKTPGLVGFVDSVVEQIDERFHSQCREILACYNNSS